MNYDIPRNENISAKDYEVRMERIMNELTEATNPVDVKRLNDEFILLWKNEPKNVSAECHRNIEIIQDTLFKSQTQSES